MIPEHSSKTTTVILFASIALLIVGVFVALCLPIISQAGNPWPQITGIARLNFGNTDIVKLSGTDNQYLTKSQAGPAIITSFLKDRGYDFIEQLGSGYVFKSSAGDSTVVTRQNYSRYYLIWNIPQDVTNSAQRLTAGLKDCLPKSDIASHETCNELLNQITNYDLCVGAGFSIMKSNPPQCAIPNGRIFVQGG